VARRFTVEPPDDVSAAPVGTDGTPTDTHTPSTPSTVGADRRQSLLLLWRRSKSWAADTPPVLTATASVLLLLSTGRIDRNEEIRLPFLVTGSEIKPGCGAAG
jgi:hypothetical protein